MNGETNKYQVIIKKENQSEFERLINLIGASVETKADNVYTLDLTIEQMINVMLFVICEEYISPKKLVDSIEDELAHTNVSNKPRKTFNQAFDDLKSKLTQAKEDSGVNEQNLKSFKLIRSV